MPEALLVRIFKELLRIQAALLEEVSLIILSLLVFNQVAVPLKLPQLL